MDEGVFNHSFGDHNQENFLDNDILHNSTNSSSDDYSDYSDNDYDTSYLYQAYPFERVIYTEVWIILVTLTLIHNAFVISILVRRKMQSPTFVILAAISISDSLTGFVTLPTYALVFEKYEHGFVSDISGHHNTSGGSASSFNFSQLPPEMRDQYYQYANSKVIPDIPPDGAMISKELCDGFMFSKFFLSKSFHTMSVWLTLLLGLQRFMIVFSPLKRKPLLQLTIKRTALTCLAVLVLAPFLHIYHLFKDKSVIPEYECKWSLDMGKSCEEDCIYFWFALLLGHLIPAIALTFFTGYFVYSLQKSTKALRNIASSRREKNATVTNRQRENRFASLIVVTVVIVFLIAELPYAVFLLYSTITAHADLKMNLKFNRAIHASYEIILLLSFNANFYIYVAFNRRFRHALDDIFCKRIRRVCCREYQRKTSVTSSDTKNTNMSEMKTLNSDVPQSKI